MLRKRSSLFSHLNDNPNPEANPSLWEHRLRQRRAISTNPFVASEPAAALILDAGVVGSPNWSSNATTFDRPRSDQPSGKGSLGHNPNLDTEWGNHAPGWLNLLLDLAWTAPIESLTSESRFQGSWDNLSYVVFFTIAWWMWTSQVFYSINFYTDDWFHLVVTFFQLLFFGALAAATHGFDVAAYIRHSPGSVDWEQTSIEEITPEQYANERVARASFVIIAAVVALSRLLLLIQYIRVALYAKLTCRSGRYPRRLLIVPAALTLSIVAFSIAFVITYRHHKEHWAAVAKFYLWGVGLLIEVIAHIVWFHWEVDNGIRLRSHGSIAGRFCDITVIILGEGINAVAGTLYAIEKAPGLGRPPGAGIVCSALIVFFLAYLYFEGAAPLKSVRRRAAWAMVHLPWLLCVILLLEGVKNQLLLTSFIGSLDYLLDKHVEIFVHGSDDSLDSTLNIFALQSGLSLSDQKQRLYELRNATMRGISSTETQEEALDDATGLWFLRMHLTGFVNAYIALMDSDTIPNEIQAQIQRYQTDYAYARQDLDKGEFPILSEITSSLLRPSINSGRYIAALCGMTFICLATLNLIQSWPRDRFQWASVISRYTMGVSMVLLLLLNVGKHQKYNTYGVQDAEGPGIFDWIGKDWVLPTLSLAYGTQFVIDTVLVYAAVWFTRRSYSCIGAA